LVRGKPLVADIVAMVNRTVSDIRQKEGPDAELTMEKIMPAFGSWVLPDHHLDVIRQKLEYWNVKE
jgi:hypothetical protein